MLHVLLITRRLKDLAAFTQGLASDPGVRLESISSGNEALDIVRANPPHLAIVDADLPDTGPLELVQRMLTINAMVNSAVVSPFSEEAFHEASEGLGVLCPLPLGPGKHDAEALLVRLRQVLGLTA